jgi:carboxyl-terminal processing protease
MKISFITVPIIFLLFSFLSYAQVDQDQLYKFNQVIENINNFYVDSVDNEKLIEKAIKSTLKELDPHSVYFSKDKIDEINRGLIGSFVGVGLSYDIIKDTVFILSIVKDGPSYNAGLLPGDRLILVDSINVAGTDITDDRLRDLLTGEKGSKVMVNIKRRGNRDLMAFEIKRDKIPVKSIDAAYLYNDIAYIKLNRFSATTTDEFKNAVNTLMDDKVNKIILDLRNNSGGYLYVSVQLLENFLEKNTTVLYTKGLHRQDKEYKTQKSGSLKHAELVVLINESSASASEIVSGAIQDWDRGVIIGRRSFGKGLVQKPIYLIDGSMMRLTIAKYYTPSGRNIQKPYNNGVDEYKKEITHRLQNGELMNKDSIKLNDSLKFYTLNNKRMIFGGGGILPDVFIPVDTLKYPLLYRQKFNNGLLNEFIHLYSDENRAEILRKFPDFKSFHKGFFITDGDIRACVEYVCSETDNRTKCFNEIKDHNLVKLQLKALIANDLFGEKEYYQIINTKDEIFLKAVEILKNKELYKDILNNNIVGDY